MTAPITVHGAANAKIDGPEDTDPRTESPQPAESDHAALQRIATEWIEVGFSPGEGTKSFSYTRDLARFYADRPGELTLHDANDPEKRVETSPAEYGRIWEELFSGFHSIRNELVAFHQVLVDGDLGLTSFTADAVFSAAPNEERRVPVFYSLVWNRTRDGWKIVHEHGSNLE